MQKTDIPYLTHTWNPIGMKCTPISAGCKNCWHLGILDRFGLSNEGLREKELAAPLRLKKPANIGVQFMGDLFACDFEWIDRVFAVMALCPQHTFQLLTKRAERMKEYFTQEDTEGIYAEDRLEANLIDGGYPGLPWPLPNVHIGVTCENQDMADKRIGLLLQTPAAKRFVSVEPMLGPVRFKPVTKSGMEIENEWRQDGVAEHVIEIRKSKAVRSNYVEKCRKIDQVIIGAESGSGMRYCNPHWMIDLVNQCKAASVAVFVKQIHVGTPDKFNLLKHDESSGDPYPDAWPMELRTQERIEK